jgi:2-keto-4-pentenoate hydratase/2-oxohepta-3-ene-1,7-dioic acid hydratase in catechol pathway
MVEWRHLPGGLRRPGKIVGVGLNYRDHAAEVGVAVPLSPLLFMKGPESVIGDGDKIVIDSSLTEFADWEVELAVVIGKHLFRVGREDAIDGIYGYTVANDVTARDIQEAEGQWFRSKSLDTFCPLGPRVIERDAIAEPQKLGLRARLNGDLVQDSSTSQMAVGVYELVEFCARSFRLEPGDVILTGTPPGIGYSMSPSRRLRHGDVIEVEIPEIGCLRNEVVELGISKGASASEPETQLT